MSIVEKINNIIPGDSPKKVIIFGMGHVGIHGLLLLKKLGKKVSYIIDNDKNKFGKRYLGVEVKSPYELLYEDWDNILVFICAGGKRSQEMAEMLEGMGGRIHYNFFTTLAEERYIFTINRIDPILGYSRGENSFEEMIAQGCKTQKNDIKKLRILTLGGSTTDPSYYGIKSWPFFLKEILDEKGIPNIVINGGIVGYNSSQEMLKLLGEGIENIQPDIVISYSGANDSAPSQYSLVHDYCVEVLQKLRECYKDNMGDIDEIYYGKPVDDYVTRYLKNMRIMHAVCEEFGVEFLGILQPIMITGKYNLDELEKEYLKSSIISDRIRMSLDFYKRAEERVKEYPWIYDFTSIFDGLNEIFFDWVHCNEKGNKVIAQNIYKLLEHTKKGASI